MKFEIRQIEAFHYDDEGWIWNTSYKVGDYKTCASDEAKAFLYALHKHGIRFKRGKTVVVDDGDIMTVCVRKTGEPLFAAIPCNN